MSDLPITPEQALQLVEIIEDEAARLIKLGLTTKGKQWATRAAQLRRYIEVSRHMYDAQKHKPPPRE